MADDAHPAVRSPATSEAMREAEGEKTVRLAARLAGTIVFTIVTASLYGSGMWMMGALLWNALPAALSVPAILGVAISPPMLFADLLKLMRDEDVRARKAVGPPPPAEP